MKDTKSQDAGHEKPPLKPLPKLLPDHPEKNDAFVAHSAIARSLAALVLNDDEGRCVALQGAWGSGKSTVIGMLTDALGNKADVFMFDTWSNQGDPLRFSFMGAFVDWIIERFPDLKVPAKKWRKRNEDTARRATRESAVDRRLKPAQSQWLAALLLVALPVGLALANEQWSKLIGDPYATWLYLFALLLVASPFLFLLILWRFYGLNFFTLIVDAIEKNAEDTKRIVVRRGPLATSLEFNRNLKTYCDALHKRDDKRKLLIVFDNIDRVAESNSARVWSLLTALLEAVHDQKAAYKSNIWVLVPVDLDSIPIPVSAGRVLRKRSSKAVNAAGTPVSDDALKLEFIEKTFQLNIVIPPPLSGASEKYFEGQFRIAFGDTDAAHDWYECYSVLREARASTQAFTPRAIKRFINDLVGLWRSRHQIDKDHIPSIAIMTLYLCTRDRIQHPDDVLNGIFTEATTPHIPDQNPIAVLAAIAFGDKVSAGLEILVRARVDSSVQSGDIKAFDGLSDADGFAMAFATYVRSQHTWLNANQSSLAKVYEVIGRLDSKLQQDIASRLKSTTRSICAVQTITVLTFIQS